MVYLEKPKGGKNTNFLKNKRGKPKGGGGDPFTTTKYLI